MLVDYKDKKPEIHHETFIAYDADVIGDVVIGEKSSIWFGAVIRGDVNKIIIGNFTNIQDGTIIHCSNIYQTIIGDFVTVGHKAVIHGCKIGNNTLIGMGAIILDGAEIGDNVIVGAGSIVTERKKIPSNSLVLGAPAKIIRELTEEEIRKLKESAIHYWELAREYKNK